MHWVGDSLDGQIARMFDCETRTGAVLDILSDRLCAAAFYIGLAWLEPNLAPAIFVYLAEFMVVDGFLSICFLAWPITSPNYFYVIDRRLWLLNWSHPGKAVNSGLFAILLLVTGWMWVGLAIAWSCSCTSPISLMQLMELGMPLSGAPLPHLVEAEERFGMDLGSRSFAGRRTRSPPVKLVLTTFVVALGSAVIPFINIEAYLAAVGAAIQDVGVWWVAGAAAVGQTAGKVALYYAADWAMRLPWIKKKMATPKWKESYERWSKRVHERPNETAVLLFASASLGFPPLYVMAVLAGQLKRQHQPVRHHLPDRALHQVPGDPRCGGLVHPPVLRAATFRRSRELSAWDVQIARTRRHNPTIVWARAQSSVAVLEPHQPRHRGHVRRPVGAEVDRGVVVVPLDAVAGALQPPGPAGADVDRGEVPAVVERGRTPSWSRRRPGRCRARPSAPRSAR